MGVLINVLRYFFAFIAVMQIAHLLPLVKVMPHLSEASSNDLATLTVLVGIKLTALVVFGGLYFWLTAKKKKRDAGE